MFLFFKQGVSFYFTFTLSLGILVNIKDNTLIGGYIMSEVTLTDGNFEKEVISSDVPVLVDFWAAWCGPCKMVAPALAKIAEKYEGKLKVGKLNVDEELKLAQQYKIQSIPTLAMFKGGEIVSQKVGALSLSALESWANEYI